MTLCDRCKKITKCIDADHTVEPIGNTAPLSKPKRNRPRMGQLFNPAQTNDNVFHPTGRDQNAIDPSVNIQNLVSMEVENSNPFSSDQNIPQQNETVSRSNYNP
jgi:hypothetical protein